MGNSYDDIIYPSFPYGQTHPFQINAVAQMFGMAPPDPAKCRVLELGCAGGGNLISMADYLPDSEFVGIDLSAKQIELGKKQIESAGLQNVRLEHGSITDVDESWGAFDYILCHGVYSWVPESVRDKIMEINKKNLKPFGIAYVSYNTYPGWHMRGMLREIMCFHASRFTKPEEQVRQSRMLLEFLSSAANEQTPYGHLLQSETNLMRRQSDAYLYHEHLEENNQPCYFFEFAQRAGQKELQYLGDANLATMIPINLAPKIKQTLDNVAGTLVEMEQYLDFLRNRTFRSSLLCHADVPLQRQITPKRMRGLHLWTCYRSATKTDAAPKSPTEKVENAPPTIEYKSVTTEGASFSSASPVLHRAMQIMSDAWPLSVPQEKLVQDVFELAEGEKEEHKREAVEALLLQWSMMGIVEFGAEAIPCVGTVSDKPKVSAVGRMQAKHDAWISSRRHTTHKLDPLSRLLIAELDGEHTHDEIINAVSERIQEQNGFLTHNDEQVKEPEKIREILKEQIPLRLKGLAQNSALIA